MSRRQNIIKNVAANLLRGVGSAIVALLLPHFLVKSLTTDRFAAWSLILQIAAYANYFEFGLQTAIARFTAQALEQDDRQRQNHLISTSLLLLIIAAVVAFSLVAIIILELPHFTSIPKGLLPEVRSACLALTLCATLLLPFSAFTAVLVGMQRNEYPTIAITASRFIGTLLVVLIAPHANNLSLLALCIGIPNLLGGAAQMMAVFKLLPDLRVGLHLVERVLIVHLAKYCGTLSIFALCMMFITGLDVVIVGHFNFEAVGYYSVAATVITFFTGLNSAAFASLLAPLAVHQTRRERDHISELILAGTRMANFVNLILIALYCLYGAPVLIAWVGQTYAFKVLPILEILLVAQAFRFAGIAYATALNATGEQSKSLQGALVEAITNLGFSIVFAYWLGPIGVAVGTLVGSVCGHLWTLTFTMRWTQKEIPINPWFFEWKGVVLPTLCLSPLLLASCIRATMQRIPYAGLSIFVVVIASSLLVWRYGEIRSLKAFK
jgi:O-antigen/teichoic acid export membrane protein